jgi:hypothetical protein
MSDATATETLETAPAIEPPEAGTPATPAATEPPARPRWGDIASTLTADDDEDDESTPPATQPEDSAKPDAPPTPSPTEQPTAPADDAPAKPRFEVLGADGKPVPMALPEGAKIVFKGDGKQVEVTTLDKLVEFAQQGVHAQRVRSEFGVLKGRLESDLQHERGRVSTAEQRADRAEEILYEILSDPDKYDQVARELAPQLSPEARENAKLKADLARREADEARERTAVEQSQHEQFWGAAREVVAERLGEFEFLTADDTEEALQTFHGLFVATRDSLLEQYKPMQSKVGLSDADFAATIEREALQVLTTDNLVKVLEKLNARYETRVRPHVERVKATSAAADAAAHNAKTTERLQRRDESVTLRRTPAPPATGTPATEESGRPRNFREHMAAIRQTLRSGIGDDE